MRTATSLGGDGPRVLLKRLHQSQLVEYGRPEAIHQATGISDQLALRIRDAAQKRGCFVGIIMDKTSRDLQSHPGGGQRWTEAIVDIATQPTALLLTGRDDPLERNLQPPIEQDIVRCHSHLPCQGLEKLLVRRSERLF